MGSWFSNFHILKHRGITEATVAACVHKFMEAKTYHLTQSKEEADAVVAILLREDSQWISVCSDVFAHDDSESCAHVVAPFSAELQTAVMGISCFDSDYLYLHLVDTAKKTDAWVGVGKGKEIGITRRNNLTAWKKYVTNYSEFSAKAKEQYVLAEEFLNDAAVFLMLPATQSTCAPAYLQDVDPDTKAVYFYYRQEEKTRNPELVQLVHYKNSLPCLVGRESHITAINIGAKAKGLSVYFLGPYVEQEEITFSDVRFGLQGHAEPIELNKVLMEDGRWAYVYHDPEFDIPPKIPSRLNKDKRLMEEWIRRITVWFTPHGNARKMLDITVKFVPDKNPDGQTEWNVWMQKGSKKAFIDEHNRIWKQVMAIEANPDNCLPLLSEEDFD